MLDVNDMTDGDHETAYEAIIRFANQDGTDLAALVQAVGRKKKAGCRLVLFHLMREFCCDQRRNSCVFRVYSMGKLLNRSSAVIIRALRRLEEDGRITIERRQAPDGCDLPNRYWVTGLDDDGARARALHAQAAYWRSRAIAHYDTTTCPGIYRETAAQVAARKARWPGLRGVVR